MKFLNVIVILCVFFLASCFSNKYEYIGEKKVLDSDNLYIKFYQKDVFEHISPIRFELLNYKDSVLIYRKYLTSETPLLPNAENFEPFLYDSILYICYPYPEVKVIEIIDKSKSHLSRDSLFKIIKKQDRKLIDTEKL